MRRVQTSEFPAQSIYCTPTELGAGPQRNELCAAISATCNETRDWLAWTIGLRYLVVSRPDPFRKIKKGSGHKTSYLHAVVSICEHTVSNKGGLPCHCLGDCVLPQGLQTFWAPHVIFTLFVLFWAVSFYFVFHCIVWTQRVNAWVE